MAGERGPLERALADPGFLLAFTEQYAGPDDPVDALRWLDDPEAPGVDGAPGPGVALRTAARDLYRPGAGERQRVEHARLEAALAASHGSTLVALEAVARAERAAAPPTAAAEEAASRESRPPAHRSRAPVLVAAGVLALVVGTAAWTAAFAPAPRPSRPVPLDFTTPIAALLEAEPQRLPTGWRDGTVVSSSDDLDGSLALLAPAGQRGRLLLVVRCAAADRSFQAVISGGETRVERYGACGRLQSLPLPVRPDALVRVVITTRGIEPFSGALVRR